MEFISGVGQTVLSLMPKPKQDTEAEKKRNRPSTTHLGGLVG